MSLFVLILLIYTCRYLITHKIYIYNLCLYNSTESKFEGDQLKALVNHAADRSEGSYGFVGLKRIIGKASTPQV